MVTSAPGSGRPCLPATMYHRQALLDDIDLGADRHRPQGDGGDHLAGQVRILEAIRVADQLIWNEIEVLAAEGVSPSRGEICERHSVGAAYFAVHLVHRAGESVGRQPARHGIRGRKGPVDFVGLCSEHTVQVPYWSRYCRQILVYSLRASNFSALNDRLEAAIDHALAVEWHGVHLGLHAGIGHQLVPRRLARLL